MKAVHAAFMNMFEQGEIERVQNGIFDSVVASYVADMQRDKQITQTADEDNRRIEMCIKIMRCLYDDKKWGLTKTLDHLSEFLRKDLDGIDWIPDDSAIWIPGLR